MSFYEICLALHSFVRWLVLGAVLASGVLSFVAWLRKKGWTPRHERLHAASIGFADLQLLLGLVLFYLSPFPRALFSDWDTGLWIRPIRFFGMEHALGMLIALVVLHVGRTRSKRAKDDRVRHRRVWITALAALVIASISIPWTTRPLVRGISAEPSPDPIADAACGPLYEARCASCHGARGRGDGPAGLSLTPRARDFTDRSWSSSRTDAELREVIERGGPSRGLSAAMPAHQGLSERELDTLVYCVRAFSD
jgi:hypothetical protein